MKLIDNIVHLEYAEFVPGIAPKGTFDSAKSRGTITIIGRGGNGNQVLIEYDSLPEKYKLKVQEIYGNPYEYFRKSLIKQYLNNDLQARKFYTEFTTGEGRSLPAEYIDSYTKAANWCNLLIKMQDDGRKALIALGMNRQEFWEAVSLLIKSEGIELPGAYAKLLEKIRKYREEGYKVLVSGKFGNSNSMKVKEELNQAMLLEMIGHHNQFDDVFVASKYNQWAQSKNYPCITAATVGNYRRRNEVLIAGSRYGNGPAHNKYGKHIKQARPSAPLLLINSDDNILDLYFVEDRPGKAPNYQYRFCLIVVMDAFNDYVLGYAAGDTVTVELVKDAYLNAANHIKQLTSERYLWQQIKTDRWAFTALKPFYEQQAHYTPATARLARGKYIEQAFGGYWHKMLKHYSNYAGHNITAKSKLNTDALERNKREYPLKEQGPEIIEQFIQALRLMPDTKTGKSRQQVWLEALNNCPQEKKRLISDMEHYLYFGKTHTHTNRLGAGGLNITIDRTSYNYELTEADYLKHTGKQVQVIYDPYDMTQVMAIGDNGNLRLMCQEYGVVPSALADFKEGDRAKLNARLEEKKRHVQKIGQASDDRKKLLDRERINAESSLQAGVFTKELRQQAERVYLNPEANHSEDEGDYNPLSDI